MNGQPMTPIMIFLLFFVAWLIFFIVSDDYKDKEDDSEEDGKYRLIDSLFDNDLSSERSSEHVEKPEPVVGRIRSYNWRKWPWYSVSVYVLLAVFTALLVYVSIRLS